MEAGVDPVATRSNPLNASKKEYPMQDYFNIERWFEQAEAQHDHNHYLDWMGGTEITCQ